MRKALRNHSEVTHVWAQQKQTEGRAGNMFFDGPSIFSYGRHFEIARFVRPDVVLFTTRRYSPSTAKHKVYTRRAIHSATVFKVPTFDNHAENALYLADQVREAVGSFKRGRTHVAMRRERITNLVIETNNYVKTFRRDIPGLIRRAIYGLDKWVKKQLPPELLEKKLAAEKKWNEEREKRYAAELQRRRGAEERARVEAVKRLEEWKSGANVSGYFPWGMPTALRLKDDRIETSRGAQITVRTAKLLWAAILAGHDVAGFKLDNYTAARIENGELIAGCHRIPLTELDRMAAELKLPARPVMEVRP